MNIPDNQPLKTFSDGKTIPQLGFGVCGIAPGATERAVLTAFETGYRHIDTATIYRNEKEVGSALKNSGLTREDVFVTGKLWNTDQGFETALEACKKSLELLDTDYLDLYLIHWAQPALGKYRQSWDALIELRERGLVKSIGVSNFTTEQIDSLKPSGVTPVVHQIELHPYLNQQIQRADNADRGILTEAWSPLGQGKDINDDAVAAIATEHGITNAQVILAWHLAIDNIVIPKSVTAERIRANFETPQVHLTADNLMALGSRPQGERLGGDPAEGDLGAPEYSDRESFRSAK